MKVKGIQSERDLRPLSYQTSALSLAVLAVSQFPPKRSFKVMKVKGIQSERDLSVIRSLDC